MVTATWENPTSENVLVRVKDPDGNFIEESDFAANNIYIVEELTENYSKTIVIDNPRPGIWDYEVVDETGLGAVSYTAESNSIALTPEKADIIPEWSRNPVPNFLLKKLFIKKCLLNQNN